MNSITSNSSNIMMISDLAAQTGLSVHALNYYLKLGLISEIGRSERSGYRLFNEETLEKLDKIIKLRQKNIPIKQILQRVNDGIL